MRFKARLIVNLKPSVKDAKAGALCKVLQRSGYEKLPAAKVGTFYELCVTAKDEFEAFEKIKLIADDVLSNPVIEEYTIISLEEALS